MQRSALVVLVACSLVFGLGVLADLVLLMFSPMMFDAPGSERAVFPWLLIGCFLLYPVLVVIGLGMGWSAYARGQYDRAAKISFLPLLAVVLLVMVVIALNGLCAGEFACR